MIGELISLIVPIEYSAESHIILIIIQEKEQELHRLRRGLRICAPSEVAFSEQSDQYLNARADGFWKLFGSNLAQSSCAVAVEASVDNQFWPHDQDLSSCAITLASKQSFLLP